MLAYHIDLKCAMWRQDYIESWAERLAAWGFDTVVIEIEDKLKFSRHPTISHPEAFSKEAMGQLVATCRAHGIDVVPMVQSLGHAEYVLSKPEYSALRESLEIDSQYDPLSDAARALILDLFDEVIECMRPGQFFHMGGDETWSLGQSPRCAERVRQIGIGGLYLEHMMPLFEHLHRRGLRPVIWADMVLSHPEIIDKLPRYVVLMDWDYWTEEERPASIIIWGGDPQTGRNILVNWDQYQAVNKPGFKQFLESHAVDERTPRDGTFRMFYCTNALRAMGFDVLTAPSNRFSCVKTGIPLHETHMANCFLSVRKALTAGLGTLVTSWAVRHTHPEVLGPAIYAASQAVRNSVDYDFEALCRSYTADYYGVESPAFGAALVKAGARLYMAEAHVISAAHQSFLRGQDPLPGKIEEMRQSGIDPGALVTSYTEARDVFSALRERAKTNAHNLDFWIEGMDLDRFYARFMQAAVEGTLKEQAEALLTELEDLRKHSRSLLAETYTHQGVDDELDQRYSFHEAYLRHVLIN